jgi:hypothetical protein
MSKDPSKKSIVSSINLKGKNQAKDLKSSFLKGLEENGGLSQRNIDALKVILS